MNVELAYRACEEITRTQAENFFYGIRLLPTEKRRALCAAYAFARRVDDIGDGDLPAPRKLERLEAERAALAHPRSHDPIDTALADTLLRFPVPPAALADLVAGVEMDVRETRYATIDELVVYCRRVAGSVGRMCVGVFGAADHDRADPLADDLGVALQLTNILRDVREDRERERVYLPAEDLAAFGCGADPLAAPAGRFAELARFEAARAEEWFQRGWQLLPLLDSRSASCVLAMAGIYWRVLQRIERDPERVRRGRISLPLWEKAWVAARSMAVGSAPRRAAA